MSNSWFRLYAEFSTDPKVQMLSEAEQRRLIMLFCSRCNNHVTLQDSEVTFLLRITPEEWAATKAVFVAKKFIDNDNKLLNWDKRQFRSDSSRERVARHRENKKQESGTTCNVTVTPQNRADTEQIQNREEGKQKASRFKLDAPPPEWISFCKQARPDLDPLLVFKKFQDHWKGVPGQKGVKLDWDATWRNWVRSENNANFKRNSASGFGRGAEKNDRKREVV